MPDVLLFGATGFTGRLTAHALARRQVDFAIAGRDRTKLLSLASEVGDPEVRIAEVGDADALVSALGDVRVMISCVGPFIELGDTAVEAALRARVHYLDSTGEGPFIARLVESRSDDARDAAVALVPAMGFDEVPADVAATLATEGLESPELTLTYAVPSTASSGTARSIPRILASAGRFIEHGRVVEVRAGQRRRWSPMPAPLGPRPAASFPLSVLEVAPLHLNLRSFETYVTTSSAQQAALKAALPLLRASLAIGPVERALKGVLGRVPGPHVEARKKRWTILAEARGSNGFRNVVVQGADVYGLTAETLAAGAARMAEDGYDRSGVLSPVQAMDLDYLQKELINQGVSVETYGPT
ncbi:MAG: saccharopine dehydrogenase family protein [Actinomycetota bacterium]